MRIVPAALLAAVAVLATGCTTSAADSTVPGTASSATLPPPAASSPAASSPAASSPAASDTVRPAPSRAAEVPQRPTASPAKPAKRAAKGVDSLTKSDWARIPSSGCPDLAAVADIGWPLRVNFLGSADITGDGAKEAFVVTSCGKNHDSLDVYDGASSADRPRRLTVSGLDHTTPFAGMRVSVDGRTARVTAAAFSPEAATCCPDLRYSQTLTWNGSQLVAGPVVHKPV